MSIYHKHHIVPRHMGGTDDPSNLIELTVEEHAQAHLDLYRQYGKEQDLIAYQSLSGQITIDEARRAAVSLALSGKKQTEEHIRKRTAARMQTNPTPTKGKKLPPCSDERKQKISKANKGKPSSMLGKTHSPTTIKRMQEAAAHRPKAVCPCCGWSGTKQSVARYHGLDGSKCAHPEIPSDG